MYCPSPARPTWRAFVVVTVTQLASAFACVPAAGAQFRVSWDASAVIRQFEAPKPVAGKSPDGVNALRQPWLDQRATGAALRFSNPFAQVDADAVLRAGDVGSRATGGMSALFATPAWKHLRLTASFDGRHVPNDVSKTLEHDPQALALWAPERAVPAWQSRAWASLSYSRNATGMWLRASNNQGALTSDSVSRWAYAAGLSHQIGNMAIGISLGTRSTNTTSQYHTARQIQRDSTVFDSLGDSHTVKVPGVAYDSGYAGGWRRWSEASATFAWSRSWFAFDAMLGARPRLAGLQSAVWGEAAAVAAVSSRVAFVAATRTTAPLPGTLFHQQRVMSLGLRLAPPALWRSPPLTPIRSVSRRFSVQAAGPGEYTIVVNVPSARTVELAGDFTEWQAITLHQVNATRWEVRLRVEPGSHRCNLRIDGAEWVPPPGIPSIADEFNGRVGLFVAE